MEVSAYVGRRILFKYWNCKIVKNIEYESVYKELEEYYQLFKDFGFVMLSEITIHKKTELDEAIFDLKKVYIDLIKEVNNFHSLKTLRLMFVATKLFLKVYHTDPIISAHIIFEFQNITYRSKCWDVMLKQCDWNNSICIII